MIAVCFLKIQNSNFKKNKERQEISEYYFLSFCLDKLVFAKATEK